MGKKKRMQGQRSHISKHCNSAQKCSQMYKQQEKMCERINKVPKQQEQAKEVSNEKVEIWTLITWCGSAKMCYNNPDDVT